MKIENKNDFFQENEIAVFSHNAMNTIFELYFANTDYSYSSQASVEIFNLIDSLEDKLSRFRPNSEINKINNLDKNSSLVLSEDTFNCLLECKNIYELTHGAFNIAIGDTIDYFKYKNKTDLNNYSLNGINNFLLDESNYKITILNKISIDLGGFAKGYTADKISNLLTDWQIENYLINCGMSTILVKSSSSKIFKWPITITNSFNENKITDVCLSNGSISASGLMKGSHIINPDTFEPISNKKSSWVYCNSAALADSLSTAFLILNENLINSICKENNISCLLVFEDSDKNNLTKKYGIFFTERG